MSAEPKDHSPSVKEIWDTTIARFQERTGQRLDAVLKTPDDLRKALDAHYAAQADGENVAKAKAVGFKMIYCFELLGGIAAQGASMVFGPAGMCFNAMSFLLDIPKKIHEFHGEINAIFAEVGPAIAQFRIYQRMEDTSGHIDEALLLAISQVMTSFIDLCANCVNIQKEGRWKSFKRSAKRILLDDGSVQGELNNFKKLTQNQLNIQATLTLEVAVDTNQYVHFIKDATIEITNNTVEIKSDTKAIKTDVSGLVEAERKRGLEDSRKKYLATIKTKLGQKDEHIANVIDARDNMWKNSVKDSGKWLNDVEEYKAWIDKASATDSFLVLTGDPGTGKSYLVSAIAQEVKSQNSTDKAERSLVGYYSFSIAGNKSDSDGRRPEVAIKSISAQLAEQDLVYAKHISGVCGETGKDEKFFRDASCQELWKTLGINSPAKNTTHFVLLDSVSALTPGELERLMAAVRDKSGVVSSEEKSSRVRVLISGEPKGLEAGDLDLTALNTIDITQHNSVDISTFITDELKNADLFQASDEDSERLRTTVEDRLLKRSNNSFSTVRQDLGKIKEIISSSGTEEELNRVLQESSTDPEALVRSDIETLEAVLKPREVEEINELLIWAVAGHGYFDLEELSAALFLRFNTVSLQPLIQKITGKYSKIFNLTYGEEYVTLKDYVEDIVVPERDRPRQSAEDPKITATITISNGDVKAVQRFFWDLNHYSFLDGFAFRPGTDMPDSGRRKIQIYRVDAHLEIVKRAFDFFLQPSVDDKAKGIGRYLMAYITHHLKALSEATGLDELQPADKQYIGSHIYDMFNDGDIIERNWEFVTWVMWHRTTEDMETIWKWLEDPVAIGRLGPRDKRWLAELKKEKNPNRSLLTPIMTMVARNWLQDTKWDAVDAYNWIEAFLTLGVEEEEPATEEADVPNEGQAGEPEQAEQTEQTEESPENQEAENKEQDEPAKQTEQKEQTAPEENDDGEIVIRSRYSDIEKIQKTEQWCKQVLGVTEVDVTWCTRLGDMYAVRDENAAAIEEYKKAATILHAQDPVDKEQLVDVYKTMGSWSTDADTAIGYYKQAHEIDPGNVEVLYVMVKRYVSSDQEEEARPLIQKAVTEKIPGTDSTILIAMLKSAVSDQNESDVLAVFKAIFSLTSSSPEWWTILQGEMEKAIETARTENKHDDLAVLLLHLGTAKYYLRKDIPEEFASAAEHWRECVSTIREKIESEDNEGVEERLRSVEQRALGFLSMSYFDKARESEGAELEESVAKLHEIYDDERAPESTKYLLASFYTFKGQPEKARELLRTEMVTVFNIMTDDDEGNDYEGYGALRRLLAATGDYENALQASFLLPAWSFNEDVLRGLLATEDGSLDGVTAGLVAYYQLENINAKSYVKVATFHKVLAEAKRIALHSEDEEEAALFRRAGDALECLVNMADFHYWCNNCNTNWDYENALHACKYCYDMDLCDRCFEELRSGATGKALACSKTHDWWEVRPWTTEDYLRACRKQVRLGQTEDGGDQLGTISKWLGNLCEEWGLSKEDWNFE